MLTKPRMNTAEHGCVPPARVERDGWGSTKWEGVFSLLRGLPYQAVYIVYRNAFFMVKLGPLLDSGKIYDPSGYFGSSKWLWDTGAQVKIRILGSFQFVLGYGKDLRSGVNSFFATVTR